MRRKLSFRSKLFLNFTLIFGVFTALVLVFQLERERSFQRANFEANLNNIAQLSYSYYKNKDAYDEKGVALIDSLAKLTTDLDIRVTVIDPRGLVVYDSEVGDVNSMENHLERPEVQEAIRKGSGSNIRSSATTGNSYYYFARAYPDYFVRAAAFYDRRVQERLHVQTLFIAYLALLFVVFAIVLMLTTRRVSETISKLKDFSTRLSHDMENLAVPDFPDDDLGEISSQITSIYSDLTRAQQEIRDEHEKLYQHLDKLEEGIAFFTPEKKMILTNQQFIQNLNLVSGKSAITPEEFFGLESMKPFLKFIDDTLAEPGSINADALPRMVNTMERKKRFFSINVLFFADRSFEIAIINTTRTEKRKHVVQQMTSNISHELKTPITSILGYLETLQQEDVPEDIRKQFTKRALRQTERLSDLISDLADLNKIEESGSSYEMESVRVRKVVDEVHQHLKLKLDKLRISVKIDIAKKLEVKGNVSLLFSIFYNLFDNVIKYGGEDIEIRLNNYTEDRKYCYFSFSNNGNAVDESHLTRIFERFYRIDKGRSREQGGTGLGLSIVKNAVELHGGKITAKSLPEGGIEFLFYLMKE